MTDDVSITQADIRAALDHLGWEDYDDFCAWALSNDEMGRFDDLTVAFARHREAGTRAPVPNGQSPNPIPSSDLDALVEELSEVPIRGIATAITSLRNQLTASEARERELREALLEIEADCVSTISSYERNGPGYTSPDTGVEYEHASFVQDKMHELRKQARTALTNTENHHHDR